MRGPSRALRSLSVACVAFLGASSAVADDADDAALVAELFPAVADPSDLFGFAVDVSGDRLVIGAWHEDSGVPGVNGDPTDDGTTLAGAAYVFVKSGSTWVQEAYLKPEVLDAGDQFGFDVAIDGDTIAVTARYEASGVPGVNGDPLDDSAPRAGACYVFVRENGVWQQEAFIKASNPEQEDRYGWSVALEGDTLAVGAIDESSAATGVNGDDADNTAPLAGATYVYTRNAGVWSQQAYLKAANAGANDRFGAAMALSGDTLVIGASSEASNATGIDGDGSDDSLFRSGAAYVFVRAGTAWSQQAYIKASNTDFDDYFGKHIALDGDLLVLGAEREDSADTGIDGDQLDDSAENAGAAYVFRRAGTTWTQEAYLKASNTDAGDNFGRAVALAGERIVVGALAESSGSGGIGADQSDDSAPRAGAAYVFARDDAGWSQRAYLKAPTPARGDEFAVSTVMEGTTVYIGSCLDDRAGLVDAGSVYVFDVADPIESFCYGDGSTGVACPCANESAPGSAAGCVHSQGVGARLTASGTTLHAADDLTLEIRDARGSEPALFLQGATSITLPFRDGLLCVGNPTERLEFAILDAGGAADSASSIVTAGAIAAPGVTRVYQGWFRDPALSPCGEGSNLTNALLVRWR